MVPSSIQIKLLLFMLLQIALLVLCLQPFDHHATRAALFTVIETGDRNDFLWEPHDPPNWYRSDPMILYRALRAEAQDAIRGAPAEVAEYQALMDYTRGLGGEGECIDADSILHIRDALKEGLRGNCAHYSWLLMGYLRSIGKEARVVGLDADDGLGGNGHAVVEVWLESPGKWMVLDVFNNAIFALEGVPLSLMEIRDLMMQRQAREIQVHQRKPFGIAKLELLDYYRRHIRNISLDGAGNLISRYQNRYGILSAMERLLDLMPRSPRRAISNLLGKGDLRVHYLDARAIPYHPRRHRALLWWLTALGLGIVTTGAIILKKQRALLRKA